MMDLFQWTSQTRSESVASSIIVWTLFFKVKFFIQCFYLVFCGCIAGEGTSYTPTQNHKQFHPCIVSLCRAM
jgi:hypothetical protein